jgi:hypothetical protein
MEISATILVHREVAAGLPKHPEHVEECIREAESAMNVKALERHRIVSGRPRLVEIRDSAIAKDQLELRFQAPTRSL